ncbi:MAG: metallopeptidase family protein [Dehalococcoidia bacterium]|nr:metallopeptidase family protein [Dehalococcoidia bacterium]
MPYDLFYNTLMELERFESLVTAAMASLPQEFQELLENVDVVVQDAISPSQARMVARGGMVLGLYEGVPRTVRGSGYNLVAPDKITIFKEPLEALYTSESELESKVREVVLHEVAHHFGLGDWRLSEIEAEKRLRLGRQ